VTDYLLLAWVAQRNACDRLWDRVRDGLNDESGEGVISAAIAVLIMAFLGVALWVAFSNTLGGATRNVDSQVQKIGQ